MTFALTLVTLLGKPLADGLIERLTQQKNGAEKLEQAANLVTKGMTAVEALRKSFGKGFCMD